MKRARPDDRTWETLAAQLRKAEDELRSRPVHERLNALTHHVLGVDPNARDGPVTRSGVLWLETVMAHASDPENLRGRTVPDATLADVIRSLGTAPVDLRIDGRTLHVFDGGRLGTPFRRLAPEGLLCVLAVLGDTGEIFERVQPGCFYECCWRNASLCLDRSALLRHAIWLWLAWLPEADSAALRGLGTFLETLRNDQRLVLGLPGAGTWLSDAGAFALRAAERRKGRRAILNELVAALTCPRGAPGSCCAICHQRCGRGPPLLGTNPTSLDCLAELSTPDPIAGDEFAVLLAELALVVRAHGTFSCDVHQKKLTT